MKIMKMKMQIIKIMKNEMKKNEKCNEKIWKMKNETENYENYEKWKWRKMKNVMKKYENYEKWNANY